MFFVPRQPWSCYKFLPSAYGIKRIFCHTSILDSASFINRSREPTSPYFSLAVSPSFLSSAPFTSTEWNVKYIRQITGSNGFWTPPPLPNTSTLRWISPCRVLVLHVEAHKVDVFRGKGKLKIKLQRMDCWIAWIGQQRGRVGCSGWQGNQGWHSSIREYGWSFLIGFFTQRVSEQWAAENGAHRKRSHGRSQPDAKHSLKR